LRFSGGIVVETADARNPPSASPSSLRGAKRRSNPFFHFVAQWIASLRSQ
jgi:hypothetical protein